MTTAPPRPVAHAASGNDDRRIEVLIQGQSDLRNRFARLEAELATHAMGTPAAAPAATIQAAEGAPSGEEDPVPTPEAIAALDDAHAIMAAAIQSGRWTESDRDRMRRTFGPLGDEGRKAILKELTQALNSRKLSLQGLRGPPL